MLTSYLRRCLYIVYRLFDIADATIRGYVDAARAVRQATLKMMLR